MKKKILGDKNESQKNLVMEIQAQEEKLLQSQRNNLTKMTNKKF